MRPVHEIHTELERATARRASLWHELSEGHDTAKAAEAAALTKKIEALWQEARVARARARFGPADVIITRGRAEDRLDREMQRIRAAA